MKINYENNQNVIDGLKEYIVDNHIKQKDICDKTSYSKQYVSNIINGRSGNLTLETLNTIVKAMDCDLIIEFRKKDRK